MHKASRHKWVKDHGFTLLELMFVVAIIGILALVAVPNYYAVKENYRLENGAQIAVSQLEYGRQMAMDNRETVYIVFQQNQVGVYRNKNGTLELSGQAKPYDGGVTFSAATTGNSWLSAVHQNPDDPNSLLLGYGVSYNFRGLLEEPEETGAIRLQSRSGQIICVLIGEGTGRIVIDQCEETVDDDDDDDDDDDEPSFCEEGDGPLPNYPAWVAQPYSVAGTYVIYDNRVFYNRWYANASDVPGSGTASNPGPWQEVTKQWRPFNYYNGGDRVCYNGAEFVMWAGYTNQHGNAPGIVNNPWQEQTDQYRAYNRYNGGDIVIFEGARFQMWAGYTNQLNKQPGIINNPWQELTDQWRNFNVYNAGDEVIHNGHRYRAKWYSQNAEPGVSNAWQLIS